MADYLSHDACGDDVVENMFYPGVGPTVLRVGISTISDQRLSTIYAILE